LCISSKSDITFTMNIIVAHITPIQKAPFWCAHRPQTRHPTMIIEGRIQAQNIPFWPFSLIISIFKGFFFFFNFRKYPSPVLVVILFLIFAIFLTKLFYSTL
jgi:hypothetical protein